VSRVPVKQLIPATALFPIKAKLGNTLYEITRERRGTLCLKRTNRDGESMIYFPEAMVVSLARRIVDVHNRLEADTRTATMFSEPVPAWPADVFDEENY